MQHRYESDTRQQEQRIDDVWNDPDDFQLQLVRLRHHPVATQDKPGNGHDSRNHVQ